MHLDATGRRRLAWQIVGGAIALGVVAWGLFHPDFRPDLQQVSPVVRAELARTGFKATHGVAAAEFQNRVEWDGGLDENGVTRQRIASIDAVVTEKRSRSYWKAMTEEASGLYVGPIAVVRLLRIWPPLIGELLPYHFWRSRSMLEFRIEERHDFPNARGGRLLAAVTYEERDPDGELLHTERRRLRCEVKDLVDAVSIHADLSGSAALIECSESLEPDGRRVGRDNLDTLVVERARFAHWYVLESGWSIPVEGEYHMAAGGTAAFQRWKAKLVSFQ